MSDALEVQHENANRKMAAINPGPQLGRYILLRFFSQGKIYSRIVSVKSLKCETFFMSGVILQRPEAKRL